MGKQDRNTASDILFEGQENFFTDGTTQGPVRPNQSESGMPVVEALDTGRMAGNRPVKDFRNPITGKTLSKALNTPDLNVNYDSQYNREGRKAFDATPAGQERIIENTPRTNAEIASDLAGGITKGIVTTGQTAFGVADLFSRFNPITEKVDAARNVAKLANKLMNKKILPEDFKMPTLDEVTGLSDNFKQTKEVIDDNLQSAQTKLSHKKQGEQLAKWNEGSDARKQKWIDDGTLTSLGAEVADLGLSIKEGLKAGIDHPLATMDMIVESAPQMLTGGVVGKSVINSTIANATKGMTKAQSAKYLVSKEGKEAIDNAATKAGVSTAAATESMINAVEKQGEIMGLTEAQLTETSDYYKSLRASGLNHNDAHRMVADSGFNITAAVASVTSALSSKATGAGKAEGKILNIDNTGLGFAKSVGKRAADTAKTTAKETLEEIGQEGGGQLAQNVAEKIVVNPEQELTENVGTGAGLGGAAGAGTGGGISAVSNIVKTGADLGKKAVPKVKKATDKVTEVVAGTPEERFGKAINAPYKFRDDKAKDGGKAAYEKTVGKHLKK
ncbi:MAG: hypothetical protein DRH90_24525, partial [Deltaproteobacteria bacterium]